MEKTDIFDKNWKTLIKPSKLEVSSNEDKSFAQVVAQPLEKGFGQTIGNSLRRILLSSIQGSAVTAIQIDGVLHEFSSIKGVREDVTDIVLNVKNLAIKSESNEPKKLVLDANGPKEIKAKDITLVSDVQILNPEQTICNLDEKTKFHMELIVNNGKGYVMATENKSEDTPLGLIAIDSLFSPVKKVSFKVDSTREGDALDYDKLMMQVETNGTVAAEDAVAFAARIFQDQLSMFVNFEDPKEIPKQKQPFPIEDIIRYYQYSGPNHFPDEIQVNDWVPEKSSLVVTAWDLSQIIQQHKLKEGDVLLINLIDYKKGIFRVQPCHKKELYLARLKMRSLFTSMEAALSILCVNDSFCSAGLEKQLLSTLYHTEHSLLQVPAFSLTDFLETLTDLVVATCDEGGGK